MAYGISVKNDNNEVLIDSDFHHYHYAGRGVHLSTTKVPDIIGGTVTQHSPNSPNTIDSDQQSGDIFKYTLAVASSSGPAPMCFIKPSSTGGSAPFASVVQLNRTSSTQWQIWILQTRGHSLPGLYCFLPISKMQSSQSSSTDSYGLLTKSSTGDHTFDSRLKPLRILGGNTVSSPSLANTGSSGGTTTNINLMVNVTPYNYAFSNTVSAPIGDLMYYCPSVAHACQERKAERDGEGFQTQGCNSFYYAWGRGDLWWCFYRSAFRISSTTNLQSSYSTYASGHVWQSGENTSSWASAIILIVAGALTGGAALALLGGLVGSTILTSMTSAGLSTGYYYPYSNSARNSSASNSFTITRASYYD